MKHPIPLSAALLLTAMAAPAADPAWWTQPGTSGHTVINPAAPDSNSGGIANIGQAKFMAKRALEKISTFAPNLATTIETNLVGPGKPIPSWDVPAPDSALAKAQYSPLLIGQLKAIAAPFYNAIHAVHPDWLEEELILNQTKDAADAANFYPWTTATSDDQNKAPATIGQLKAVFSLRFENLDAGDADADGMADGWEICYGLNPLDPSDAAGDLVGDGVSNLVKYQLGRNPLVPALPDMTGALALRVHTPLE